VPTWGIVAVAALVALAGAGSYVMLRPAPPPVVESRPIAPGPDQAITSRLTLAAASLDARNYRAALAYSEQVLSLDAKNAEALKIRDTARATLSRFDAAIADARRRLAARDRRGAEEALDIARGIDAGAPGVTQIALQLAEQARPREQAVETPRRGQSASEPQRRTSAADPAPQSSRRPEPPSPLPPPAPRVESRPVEPIPSTSAPTSGTAGPTVPPAPVPVPAKPSEPPASTNNETRERQQAAPSGEQDESAIRRVIGTYARAIENKDVQLFRSVVPNLSREAERRLEEGFRAVTSQRVDLTILSIERRGDRASVLVRRRDTIEVGRRQQTAESQQAMTLARTGRDWTIVDIR
jgi:hypothetical protein